jgi:hypothetical protein
MSRALFFLAVALVVSGSSAGAVTITAQDVESFGSPCSLSVAQNGSVRTLSWAAVSGASTYKVGYRLGGTIVALAEVTGTSYEHSGWSSGDCLEYLLVACDGGGGKVCAAHVPNVGSGCPQ